MTLIEMSKPYFIVEKLERVQMTSKFEMTFTLNGCINITDVNIIVNDVTTNIAKEGYCNYLLPEGKR